MAYPLAWGNGGPFLLKKLPQQLENMKTCIFKFTPPTLSAPTLGKGFLRNPGIGRHYGQCRAEGVTGRTEYEGPDGVTEDKIAKLLAANERLLARIEELEKIVREGRPEISEYLEGIPKQDEVPGKSSWSDIKSSVDVVEKVSTSEKHLSYAATQEAAQILEKVGSLNWPTQKDEAPFWTRKFSSNDELLFTSLSDNLNSGGTGEPDKNPLYVVHVTAEMAPVAKVGGLGDVVTGLGRACLERGHRVLVMLPFYESIDTQQVDGLTEADSFSSFHKGSWVPVQSFHGRVAGVPVLLIRPGNHLFRGSRIYGGSYDEMEAYLFFSRACLERMQVTGDEPDIIHVHEWQTGALPMLYWDIYHHLSLRKARIVLTIHNMEHYGECRLEQLNMCGLEGLTYCNVDRALDERTVGHNPERLSLLKAAIVYSNAVTTVSPTYANETLCTGWMANTLLKHRDKYVGILNGIDTTLWNPTKDPCLPMEYAGRRLFGKLVCKCYVQRGLGLDVDDLTFDANSKKRTPLVICITRLVAQKGIHLIRHVINTIGERGAQFVLLGTSPDPSLRAEFEHMSLQNSKNIRLLQFYSEDLAHMLYAAGDIVLVPSMFEPCGLTQMIGMRYGAIPVVRRTGGLADTVWDVDDLKNQTRGNGFVFDGISGGALDSALERALTYYKERKEWWQDLTSYVMELDHSWNKSAKEYLDLYNSIRV